MRTIIALLAVAVSVILISSFGGDDNSDYPGGSPGGYTGSPADGKNCTNCHGGSATPVTGWITSDVPASGYTPGSTYTITVTLTGSGNKGFECSPQDASGTLLGTLTPGSGQHLVNGNKAVTQSSKKTSNPATWSFSWKAPAAGTGNVTFYGAFVVSKPVIKLCTMTVSEYAPAPLTVTASATPDHICNGSVSQLNASPAGGGGTYSYSWSSIPAGYASSEQNPVVQPSANTQYIVTVSDGTNNASDTVSVDVTLAPTSFAGNDTTCNLNVAEIQLHGQAGNYSSLLWASSGDGSFSDSGVLNPVYFPGSGDKTTGWVNLYLTASPNNPCSGSASSGMTVTFASNVGLIDGTDGIQSTLLFPNPSNGSFRILRPGDKNNSVQVGIFDFQGRKIETRSLHFMNGLSGVIDMTDYPKGVYFIGIRAELTSETCKVILY